MCALCGVLIDGPHWTEAGTNAGRVDKGPVEHMRLRERQHRISLINHVLKHYSCIAQDWVGSQYIVKNLSGGASTVVINLPQLWQAIEDMCRLNADPLDAELLNHMEGNSVA